MSFEAEYPESVDRVMLSPKVSAALSLLLHAGSRNGSYAPPYDAIEQGHALVSELRGAAPTRGPSELDARAEFIWRALSDEAMPLEGRPSMSVGRRLLQNIAYEFDTQGATAIGVYANMNHMMASLQLAEGLDKMVHLTSQGASVERVEADTLNDARSWGGLVAATPADIAALYRDRPEHVPAAEWQSSREFAMSGALRNLDTAEAYARSPHMRGWVKRTSGPDSKAEIPALPAHRLQDRQQLGADTISAKQSA